MAWMALMTWASHPKGIKAAVGRGAVATAADDAGVEGIHGGHHVTAADTEGARIVLAGDVEGDDGIQPFDGAIIEHSGGAG